MRLSRRTRIELLLGSLLDLLPAPVTWSGQLVRQAGSAGEVASRWLVCPSCGGERETRDRFGRLAECVRCMGRGRLHVDAYTLAEVGSVETGSRPAYRPMIRCDRCQGSGAYAFRRCWVCDGSGWVPALLAEPRCPATDDRVLAALERRQRSGSYREIEQGLVALKAAEPPVYGVVWRVDVEGLPRRPQDEDLREVGLGFLDQRMPSRILVPRDIIGWWLDERRRRTLAHGRWAAPQARARRDREIRAHHRAGRPVTWLSVEYGLSKSAVYEILGRAAA